MLTIECVNPTGFFSYACHETIPLDNQGVVLLTGINRDRLSVTANAAGKSSLLNTVAHILYGQNPTEKGEDKIVNSVWGRGCWGMLKFSVGGRRYRIILTRSWKGPYPDATVEAEPCQIHVEGARYEGTCLYYDIFDGTQWADLRKTRVSETRAQIISDIDISYDRFLATSYLAQQKGLAFITGKNRDRMELITELTDMKIWDRCVEHARAKSKVAEAYIETFKRDILTHTTKADTLATTTIKDIETATNHRDSLSIKCELMHYDILNKEAELKEIGEKATSIGEAVRGTSSAIDSLSTTISNLTTQISNQDIAIAKLQEQQKQPPQDPNIANGNAARASEIINNKWSVERQLSGMLPGAGKCDKCGSIVSDEALAAEREELHRKLDTLEVSLKLIEGEMDEHRNAASQYKIATISVMIDDASSIRESLREELETAKESQAASKLILTSLNDDLSATLAASKQKQIDIINAKALLESHTKERDTLDLAIKRDNELRQQISALREEAAKIQDALNLQLDSLRYHEAIIKGMGDKGIKAHKFGAIIQTLNEIVADNIRVLTDGQVQVWFSPWREKASAKHDEDVIPEIQVFVKEGPKEQVELALYSGMERQQIVIAIIRAFNKLAMLQGQGTNLLFMDEMFGMFDEASAATTIKLMNQLKNSDWGTIVVVTHNQDIKQLLDYDQLWVAEKQNHITTLKREKLDGSAAS